MKGLSHENIIRIENLFFDKEGNTLLVMEYFEGTEMLDFIQKEGKCSEGKSRELFGQLIRGI